MRRFFSVFNDNVKKCCVSFCDTLYMVQLMKHEIQLFNKKHSVIFFIVMFNFEFQNDPKGLEESFPTRTVWFVNFDITEKSKSKWCIEIWNIEHLVSKNH